jgi:ATP-dependent exoDNAse (exonuclease V) beta subunit
MHSTNVPFTVMDASAGSGKTRNLVKAVLLQALAQSDASKSLKSVLALTFTNKAAAEMKHRLLEYLIDFAQEKPKETALLKELTAELELDRTQIQARARQTLTHLLHHYNDLSFGTLDSFTSRLVRTFAKDMALSESFEITLNLESLLQETTDAVMSMAGQDKELTDVLVRFVEQKLEEERSPNIDGALLGTAKKLMQERHREPLDRMRKYTPEQLLTIRKKLQKRSKMLLAQLQTMGDAAIQIIQEQDLDASLFYRGKQGVYNYLLAAQQGRVDYVFSPNSYVTATLEEGKWYSGKAKADDKMRIDAIAESLTDATLAINQFALEHAPFILLAEKISQNMFALATLNALNQELNNLTEARNTLPLAAFNHIIHEQLKNEPSLYIYERLGDRYNHFFLDEFQDTSLLQWGNLRPLVADSTAAGGTALVVGDAKQSIYRWRNGEAEQFIELSKNANEYTFQFQGDAQLERLGDNWRSLENIVDFNNKLFTHAAQNLDSPGYKYLYEKAGQTPKKGSGGFINLKQFPGDDFVEETLEDTLRTIGHLREAGYMFADIAVLVRNHTSGSEVVQLLTTEGIPVVSGDSQLIGNAYEGKLLAGATALRTSPEDKTMRWLFADALLRGKYINPNVSPYALAHTLVHQPREQVIETLEVYFPGIEHAYKNGSNLYGFTRELMRLFKLAGRNNAFAETYLQAIHDFVEKDNGTDFDFVRWWHDEGYTTPISAAENMDAVQVVTIHKSKGLQYPVVLLPFAKWKNHVGAREAWIELDPDQFEGLEEMIVNVSSKDAHVIGGDYEKEFTKLSGQEVFDSLNMLYVACTRAIERLYINFPDNEKSNNIATFLTAFVEAHEDAKLDEGVYAWGEAGAPLEKEKPTEPVSTTHLDATAWQQRLKLARTAPPAWHTKQRDARDWGNRVHHILAQIESNHDVPNVLQQMQHSGRIPTAELTELQNLITTITTHPTLAKAFAPGNKVYNERDILLPGGERKRPDRICMLANGEVLLLDYKTGAFENKHKKQLKEYATQLAEAGMNVSHKYLVYSAEELEVVPVVD